MLVVRQLSVPFYSLSRGICSGLLLLGNDQVVVGTTTRDSRLLCQRATGTFGRVHPPYYITNRFQLQWKEHEVLM
jgi:hypothetical protein